MLENLPSLAAFRQHRDWQRKVTQHRASQAAREDHLCELVCWAAAQSSTVTRQAKARAYAAEVKMPAAAPAVGSATVVEPLWR